MTEAVQTIVVSPTEHNQRMDLFLTGQLAGLSRSHVQKIIGAGQATVNGKVRKANYKLQAGDALTIRIPEPEPLAVVAEDIPLAVLYEDHDVIVINKARGMVVHPAVGNQQGTLVNALLGRCSDLSGINGTIRPGIVHRLDKDTSGTMIVAKTDLAHLQLAQQIKEHSARRKYLALVHGNIKAEDGLIDAPLGRHPIDRKKMAVVFTHSRSAKTNFKVVERFGNYTLVECCLQTGRTHQIRVHMAYIGHPVVSDPKYGPKTPHFAIKGQALHSWTLTFTHPVTAEELTFESPIPEDMGIIIEQLRKQQGL